MSFIVWKCPKDGCDESFTGPADEALNDAFDHLLEDHR